MRARARATASTPAAATCSSSDVLIVGGGLAGACLARLLGQQGLEVELYDKGQFPREKACGEGLMPAGVAVLSEVGLAEAAGGQPLRGVRYHVADGDVRADFPPDRSGRARYGLGQRRLHLDNALWCAAAGTPGVSARQGARIERPLLEGGRLSGVVVDGQPRRARIVVAADGASSTLRRKLGLERASGARRAGIRAHFRRPPDQPMLHDVQVFVRRGYELYVTPLPDNELLVAALTRQDVCRGSLKCRFQGWIEEEPLLRGWLEGATQTSELMGQAPLVRHASSRRRPPGLVLLGDAAVSVDPITAGGMSLALLSAQLLARELPAVLHGDRRALRRFERLRARAVFVHQLLGAGLLALEQRPLAARAVQRLMKACPGWMSALVELTCHRPGMREVAPEAVVP